MKYIAGIIAAAAVIFGVVAVAQAEDIVSSGNSFVGSPFEQAAGEISNYVNPADGNGFHNVVAEDDGPDGEPLFASDLINVGQTSPLAGAQYLGPGTYHFLCTVHPGMEGDLLVTGGTPVARPKVKLSVPSQKLKKARKTGKIKVDVKAVTQASGVDLELKKGNALIGTALDLSVDKGKTRTVSIALTPPGVKAIKKGNKVTVTVDGTLPFGKPTAAKGTLR